MIDALAESAPNGVDRYFDNVGGVISSKILSKMTYRGRIAVCGSISGYNAKTGEEVLGKKFFSFVFIKL